jgi:hypothetical protein
MPSIVFEQHLFKDAFKTSKFADDNKPLSESCDVQQTIAIFKALAESMSDGEPLVDTLERLGIANGWSPQDLSYVEDALCGSTQRAFKINESEVDESSVRSFLELLSKPFPKADTSTSVADHTGYQPHPSEAAAIAALKLHRVSKYPEPFGNDWLGGVRQFDRLKHRYGKANVDVNAMSAVNQLASPILRTSNEAFVAMDSQGLGMPHQYRVLNTIRNEWVSPQMHMRDAIVMAQELNAELDVLAEQQKNLGDTVEESITRKHFREVANAVRAIEHTGVRQELADHHAEIFAKQNPRFDHSKFRAACGTKTKAERGIKEAQEVANIPIMENLLQPMGPMAQAALRHLESSHLKNGSASSFGDTNTGITAMQDFKAKENLLMEARKRENPLPSEEDAIRAQSVKNMHARTR